MKIRIDEQKFFCFAIGCLISMQAIAAATTNLVAAWLPQALSLYTPLLYASFYLIVIAALLFTGRKPKWRNIFAVFFVVVSFLFTIIVSEASVRYMWTSATDILENPVYRLFLATFPAFLISAHVTDTKQLAQCFEKFSYAVIVLALAQFVTAKLHGTAPEYMTFSYNILFHVAFLCNLTIQQPSWRKGCFAVVGAFLVTFAGCRGALLGLIVAVGIYYLFGTEKAARIIFYRAFGLAALCGTVMFFWEKLLSMAAAFLQQLGINSRTMQMMLLENFWDSSGRAYYYQKTVDSLNLLGHGLYGDRVLLRGHYVHSIALEILLDYGLVLGTVLLCAWIVVICAGIGYANQKERACLCALFSIGCVKLFLSGSFLNQEPGFFLMIGLCLNSIQAHRRKQLGRRKHRDENCPNQYGAFQQYRENHAANSTVCPRV